MHFVLSPDLKIAIVGLGYVGLPLALAFAEKYKVIGYDIDGSRINALTLGKDGTNQVTEEELRTSALKLSHDKNDLVGSQIYIVTVPTPVTQDKIPNLSALLSASRLVGSMLQRGDLVIYESTVYPGCTEEDCVPVLEESSGLKFNEDFFCGYSPERISPGDSVHTLKTIIKVTSGSTPEVADRVDELYKSIVPAGTHKAPSIKVAEASKAIENAQRDVNISFVNELALIFDKMDIDTTDVLDAASTKWNFIYFKPGLVGGHCIGVDPYYLSYKAEKLGYHPRVILSGRKVNDHMASFVVNKAVKLMVEKNISSMGSNALVLGITFKENCPDIRNSKVVDIMKELTELGFYVDVFDPVANAEEVSIELGIALIDDIVYDKYQLIIHAVAHAEFRELDYTKFNNRESVLFDARSALPRKWVDGRL